MAPKVPPSTTRAAREKGIAVMLTAFMLIFTIPIVGLAIDAGMLYLIRAKLSAACDAAALATARNLNLGLTLAEQTTSATQRGTAFFNANFPVGYMGTTSAVPTITVTQATLNTLNVTATATANAPLYFMRYIGTTAALASSTGRASRRDVNLILVLDRSGSMQGQPCTDMISASKTFVNMFVNGRDRLGMISFGASVYNAYAPTKEFKAAGSLLTAAIDQVTCNGWTNTSQAYWNAYQQLVTINQPLALNMIVFFTDGVPTAFTANFPVKTLADQRRDYSGGPCGGTDVFCNVPRTTCRDDNGRDVGHAQWGTFAPKFGVITGGNIATSSGDTNGLVNPVATSFSTGEPMIPAAQRTNCQMSVAQRRLRYDLAYVPWTDANGLNTTGYQTGLLTFGAGHAYQGFLRLDRPNNIARIGMNLADNAATVARNNADLGIVTYTIGLGSNGGVDDELLERMANDLNSSSYDNTKVNGLYIFAPTSSDLGNAFARIASEILRLAQ
jgi:Flp pilus assembly protein TadG